MTTPCPDVPEDQWRRMAHELADIIGKTIDLSTPVRDAFVDTPRHVFLSEFWGPDGIVDATHPDWLSTVYTDTVLVTQYKPTGDGVQQRPTSSSSQPSLMADMITELGIAPGHRVVEVGTGTGYNAALLAHLVGEHGHVTTMDIDADLTDNARAHLAAAGVDTVHVVTGDGAACHAAGAPYDRIIATVGAHTVPDAWLDQLAPDGRLVIPLRIAGDNSRAVTFTRHEAGDGVLVSQDTRLCTFMPLRGGGVGDDPRTVVDLTGDGAVTLQTNQDQDIQPAQVDGILHQPARETSTGVTFGTGQPLDLMWLWLALHLPNALSRMLASDSDLVTTGLGWGSMATVPAVEPGLAYLTLRRIQDNPFLCEAGVTSHGDAGHVLARHMAEHVRTWHDRRDQTITVTWYPADIAPPHSGPGRFVLGWRDGHLVVAWEGTA